MVSSTTVVLPSLGANSYLQNWQENVDERIKWGLSQAIALNVVKQGDTIVVVQGWKGGMGFTNTIRIVKADTEHLGIGKP